MKKIFIIFASCLVMANSNAELEEIFGNSGNGDNCGSDYQCESLCCQKSAGVCGAHNPTGEKPEFCNKPAGESCIISEFCSSYSVTVCNIYKIGLKPDGTQACTLKCSVKQVRGSCVNKVCQAPRIPPVPHFDPNDCSNAIDP